METTITPLKDRILVKEIKENQSEGGIFIPTTKSGGSASIGEAVAIGKEVNEVCAGDTVYYDTQKAFPIDVKGQKLFVLTEKDILAFLN